MMAGRLSDQEFPAKFEQAFIRWEPAFPLSEDERSRVASAPFRVTPEGWRRFALSIHDCVIHGYRHGEMGFKRALEIMRLCSLGCSEHDRVELLALTADRALRLTPKTRNASPPPYPAWQRKAAVDLVLQLKQELPDLTDRLLRKEAIRWLTTVGLAAEYSARQRRLSDRTLERWVREHRQAQGTSRPRGRPGATQK
jgi:hypothetical protein